MAHYRTGVFLGFRELALLPAPKQSLRLPASMPRMPSMRIIEVESLKTPTYDSATFAGNAPDHFPAELIQIGFATRMLAITISGGHLDIEYSFDGETVGSRETLMRSHRLLKAIQAFRVRSAVPGWKTWYQVLCMR